MCGREWLSGWMDSGVNDKYKVLVVGLIARC